MKHPLKQFTRGIRAHKVLASFITVVILVGGYEMVHAARSGSSGTQYTLALATTGSIIQTVSGSGQVSAANQLDVTSQASGAITSIAVAVGDHVAKGQLLATIDDSNAKNSLLSAKLSLAQLVEPAKQGDITNAENSLEKSYSDALGSVRSSFTDLQTVIPGLDSLLYSQSGYLGTSNSVYLTTTGQQYRNAAGVSFDIAKSAYQNVLAEYSGMPANPATSTQQQIIDDTSTMLAKVATALKNIQAAITYITVNETQYQASGASTAKSNVASWLSLINSDVSSIANGSNSIAANSNSLDNLLTGADPLQIQASELQVQQAQSSYDNYFVRAPFDGIVGRIPVSVYGQASGGTVIATIVGSQKVANISLDEVDAAKVRAGQTAAITFDAINDLVATGTVSQVDLVGTVSGGVVSYNVRIVIDTADDRIRPGMSLNVTITTNRKDNALIVPSAAVKTAGGRTYVQTFDKSVLPNAGQMPSNGQFSSSTTGRTFGSTTRQSGDATSSTPRAARQFAFTVTTTAAPQNVPVVTGISDDQNTEIVSGIDSRTIVVTKSGASGTTAQSGAPSILGAFGGGARTGGARPAGGGNVRIGG